MNNKEVFFKWLAVMYALISGAFVIAIWSTGLFWEIIEAFVGDLYSYSNFYGNYSEVVDWSYFCLSFLNIFVKASFIFYKGWKNNEK